MNDRDKLSLTGSMSERSYRYWVWATQVVPLLGVVLAFALAFKYGIGWMEIITFLCMSTLGAIGIEIGLHRYFSHKAFKVVKPLSGIFAILGSMAAMSPIFFWVYYHRKHHQHSDTEKDPHSPNDVYNNKNGFFRRLLFAHFGWNHSGRFVEFDLPAETSKDLFQFTDSRFVLWAGRNYNYWVLLGILLPAGICFLLQGTWYSFLSGALWGGLVRIAVGQHTVWMTNSIAHNFGGRLFETNDKSVNNQYGCLLFNLIGAVTIYLNAPEPVKIPGVIVFVLWCTLISVGGGWHNNHHAFPSYAVQQYSWWQIDPFGWLILLWQRLGLASSAARPSKRKIRNYRAKGGTTS